MTKYQISEVIEVRAGSRCIRYLGNGWSLPETSHCWTDGSNAQIKFTLATLPVYPILFRIKCKGFLPQKNIKTKKVEVIINGSSIGKLSISDLRWYDLTASPAVFESKECCIDFIIEDPTSPFAHGLSDDRRNLGLYVESFSLFELLDKSMLNCVKVGASIDMLGTVYKSSGAYHRLIGKQSYPFYQFLQSKGILEYLIDERLIVDHVFQDIELYKTCIASSELGRYIYPAFYPFSMLKDCALNWTSINLYLSKCCPGRPLGLSDGHYGNFIQIKNATPRWCDLGSISDIKEAYDYGLHEFIKCYILPLLLVENNINSSTIRRLMHLNPSGLSKEILSEFLAISAVPEWIFDENLHKTHRENTLTLLLELIKSLSDSGNGGFWTSYRDSFALTNAWSGALLSESPDSRYRTISDIVRGAQATTFLDLGCNDGLFSLLCLKEGLKGSSIDTEDGALEKFYDFTRALPYVDLCIYVHDFLSCSESADLVLCLALTHHLSLGQGLSFAEIADKLSRVTENTLITEFMPNGLGGTKSHPNPSPNPLPRDYSLDVFLRELRLRFSSVEVIEYARGTDYSWYSVRNLILCKK